MRSFITKIFFAIFSVLVCINAVYGGNQREEYQKAIHSVLEQHYKIEHELLKKKNQAYKDLKDYMDKTDRISLHHCPSDFIDVLYKYKASARRLFKTWKWAEEFTFGYLIKWLSGRDQMEFEDFRAKWNDVLRIAEKYGVNVTKYK